MEKKKNGVLTPEGCGMFLAKDYVAMEVGETFDKALTRYRMMSRKIQDLTRVKFL